MTTGVDDRPVAVGAGSALRVRLVVPECLPDRWAVALHVSDLAARLSAHGHEVVVATQQAAGSPLPDRERRSDGVVVRRFASVGAVRGRELSPELWRWLRDGADGADVVHVHDVHALVSIPALALAPRPVVLTPHYLAPAERGGDAPALQVHATAGRRVLQRVSRIICSSAPEAAAFVRDLGAGDRVVTVPAGDDGCAPAEAGYREVMSRRPR